MQETAEVPDVRRVQLNPGDRIVLTYKGRLSDEARFRLRQRFAEWAGWDIPIVVLEEGVTLTVVPASDTLTSVGKFNREVLGATDGQSAAPQVRRPGAPQGETTDVVGPADGDKPILGNPDAGETGVANG